MSICNSKKDSFDPADFAYDNKAINLSINDFGKSFCISFLCFRFLKTLENAFQKFDLEIFL